MSRDLGVSMSYTLETSFFGFLNKERVSQEFSVQGLLKIGRDLARVIMEYWLINERARRARLEHKRNRNIAKASN